MVEAGQVIRWTGWPGGQVVGLVRWPGPSGGPGWPGGQVVRVGVEDQGLAVSCAPEPSEKVSLDLVSTGGGCYASWQRSSVA